MKLKQRPEDFRVEERTDASGGPDGPFAFYRLTKTGWTTPDALNAVRRRWQIDGPRLSYGGLKDRHAVTAQFFTVFRGPRRDLAHERVSVAYLGQRTAPYTSRDIRANRFEIALRSLKPEDVERAVDALAAVADAGLPNYFDDQRFGSTDGAGEFVAREMVFGRFERALHLALAAPYDFDRADEKAIKAILRDKWGHWAACRAALPKSHARSLVDYLASHPADFKGAVARLRPDLHGLYLSAYQSHLWNRMLALWIAGHFEPGDLASVELKLGKVPVPTRSGTELRIAWEGLALPLPSARLKPSPEADWAALVDEALREEGLALNELRIKGMQRPFFSKGNRAACVRPADLTHAADADELNPNRRKLVLRFEMPKGSYATMLVKRVTALLPFEGQGVSGS